MAFICLSVPVDKGYVVPREDAERFLSEKPDRSVAEMHKRRAEIILKEKQKKDEDRNR